MINQPRKRRGAKERVLARYPGAFVYWTGPFRIAAKLPDAWLPVFIGDQCNSEAAAWASAARRINDDSK